MDQVRTALLWLKRHHFWVLCGLIVMISLFSWMTASGKLRALFAKNESEIKAQFTSVKNVRSDPFHPNEDVNTKQQAQTTEQAAAVGKLWEQLYDRQRQHVLGWPEELSREFRAFVEKLQFGADIRSDLRNHYQNYIENHFPALPKEIEARPVDPSVTAGAGGPGGAEFGRSSAEMPGAIGPNGEVLDDNNYITEWSPADQAIIRDELNFREQPSSLKIWVTQEDLWVYHNLLDVIAKTNKAANATRISNAAVQQIGELAVGSRAGVGSHTSGRLWVKPAVAAAAAGPGGPEGGAPPGAAPPGGEPGGRPSEFGPGGPGGMNNGPMTEEQERGFLLSNRYLGPDGKPIPFGAAGAAAPSPDGGPPPPPDPAAASAPLDLSSFGTEYKRLPVRMALRMDQRWLPQLIAECASQPLQIEVTEVRIIPQEGIGGSGTPGAMGRPGDSIGGGSVFTEEPGIQPFPTQTEMVNVIIQGTVYIFNKPNAAALQPGGAGAPGGEQAPPPTTAAVQQ